jgi:Ca2+-dependent lipid-binding protein
MDNNGLSDPYCRILVAGQKACKTSIIKKSLNPKWEPPAEAKFTLNDLQQVVEIEVWDKVWVALRQWAALRVNQRLCMDSLCH